MLKMKSNGLGIPNSLTRFRHLLFKQVLSLPAPRDALTQASQAPQSSVTRHVSHCRHRVVLSSDTVLRSMLSLLLMWGERGGLASLTGLALEELDLFSELGVAGGRVVLVFSSGLVGGLLSLVGIGLSGLDTREEVDDFKLLLPLTLETRLSEKLGFVLEPEKKNW